MDQVWDLPGLSLEISDCVLAAIGASQIITILQANFEHSIETLCFLGIS